jgi:hypothetical protein
MTSYIEKKTKFIVFLPAFIILIYIYLYNPPFSFLPIGPIKIIYPIALLYILSHRLIRTCFGVFKIEALFVILILLYSLIRGGLFGDSNLYFRNNFSFFFESFVISFFIASFNLKYLRYFKLESAVVVASSIAALITFLLILNPSFASFVNISLLSTEFVTEYEDEISVFRRFGLAEGLTYGYGIGQGLVLSIIMFLSKENKKLLLLTPIFFIAILFNARSGFIPPLLILFYLIFFQRRISGMLFIAILFSLIYLIFNDSQLFISYADTFLWGMDFLNQIIMIFDESSNVSNNYLLAFLGPMLIIPDSFVGIIFGQGINIFANSALDIHSDVGFSQQIMFGGLFYIFILFGLIFYMAKRLITKLPANKWFVFIFISSIILLNIKGYFLWSNTGSKLLFLMYVYFIVKNKYELQR